MDGGFKMAENMDKHRMVNFHSWTGTAFVLFLILSYCCKAANR